MTTRRWMYLIATLLGVALPYAQFVPFLLANGLDLALVIEQLFANRISAFFGWDVIISAVVLLLFIAAEVRRLGVRHWWVAVSAPSPSASPAACPFS